MIATSAQRVERHTPPPIKQQIEAHLAASVARHAGASAQDIDARLAELDREWNTERIIELEAPLTIGLGLALGAWRDKRWYALSAMAASMVVLRGVQGWYPLLPVLRRPRCADRTAAAGTRPRMGCRATAADEFLRADPD